MFLFVFKILKLRNMLRYHLKTPPLPILNFSTGFTAKTRKNLRASARKKFFRVKNKGFFARQREKNFLGVFLTLFRASARKKFFDPLVTLELEEYAEVPFNPPPF